MPVPIIVRVARTWQADVYASVCTSTAPMHLQMPTTEVSDVSDGLHSMDSVQLCHWDTAITAAYITCAKGDVLQARTQISAVFVAMQDVALRPAKVKGETSELQQWKHQFGRLRVRCNCFLSVIQYRAGAVDCALPLAEDCLSCSVLLDKKEAALIDYSPRGFAEQSEMVDAFFHVANLHVLMGSPGPSEYYLDQVKRICHWGLRHGDWAVSRHYVSVVALLKTRLLKMQHRTEEAFSTLKRVFRLQYALHEGVPISSLETLVLTSPQSTCGPQTLHLHLYLQCCTEYGELLLSVGDAEGALSAYRSGTPCYLHHSIPLPSPIHRPRCAQVRTSCPCKVWHGMQERWRCLNMIRGPGISKPRSPAPTSIMPCPLLLPAHVRQPLPPLHTT